MHTCQVDGLVVQRTHTTPSASCYPGHQMRQCVLSSCNISSSTFLTSHHFQRHYENCESASISQSGTSHKTCLRGFGGNGCIARTSAVSHEGRPSIAFKVSMKLQTFLFQMIVTSCISVQYLWKYGFTNSDNLYSSCIFYFYYCNHLTLVLQLIYHIHFPRVVLIMKLKFFVWKVQNSIT